MEDEVYCTPEKTGLMGGAGPSDIPDHLRELAQKYRTNKMICRKCYARLPMAKMRANRTVGWALRRSPVCTGFVGPTTCRKNPNRIFSDSHFFCSVPKKFTISISEKLYHIFIIYAIIYIIII